MRTSKPNTNNTGDSAQVYGPLVRVPVARTIIPVGNTKFWELVKKEIIEVIYIDGIPFCKTASLLRLIDESPSTKPATAPASAPRAEPATAV
jgi:hypothetical protein